MNKPLRVRASECHYFAARARTKTPALSQGAQTRLLEIWLRENCNYSPEIAGKEIKKGNWNEDLGIQMYSKYYHNGDPIFKNTTRKTIGHLTGEADIILPDLVPDIKNSYTPATFIKADLKKDYEWQLRAYMMLYDKPKAHLVYCLTDLPDHLYEEELRKFCWQNDILDPDAKEYAQIIQRHREEFIYTGNPLYPEEQRIKVYSIERDQAKEDHLMEGIELALEYYSELSLNYKP